MMLPTSLSTGGRPLYFALFGAFVLSLILFHGVFFGTFNPASSLRNYQNNGNATPWLLLTISNADHLQRRQIIRNTWQKLYRNPSIFHTRFVISDPGPIWRPMIEAENATYGDLIMLNHRHEDHDWANRVKSMEAFKHVLHQNHKYTFVSKVDEDSFVEAKTFWEIFLQPRIGNETVAGTYIGRSLQHDYPYRYASGQFYTLSWDMMEQLVHLWDTNHITDEHEDVLTGRLLYEAGVHFNLTVLKLRVAFDYDDNAARGDGSAFNKHGHSVDDDLHHGITAGSLAPHNLKEDEKYLRVAACYDSNGVKGAKPLDWSKYMETVPAWTDEKKDNGWR